MLGYQEKRRFRHVLSSKITIAILLVVIFLVARGVWGVYLKERDSSKSLAVASRAYAELDSRQQQLSSQIAELKTSRGVEEEIRSRYEVAKPGEDMALVVDDATSTATSTQETSTWWQELFSWVLQK